MNRSRVTKLERQVRSRPCLGCRHPYVPPELPVENPGLEHLSADEGDELVQIFHGVTVSPYARCGRVEHDLTRLTDDQLDRAPIAEPAVRKLRARAARHALHAMRDS